MPSREICTTPGCLQAAENYGLCWRCHGDTRSFDNAVRTGIRGDIQEGAKVAHEAWRANSAALGGVEQATRLLRAAGLRVNGVALFSKSMGDIQALLSWAQGTLEGQDMSLPMLAADNAPLTDRRGLPFSEEAVRSTEVLFIRREQTGEMHHPDYDVAWLRRLAFEADLDGETVVVKVPRAEMLDETERLADVIQGTGRRGVVSAVYKARAEYATVRWEGRDLGGRPDQFLLGS